MCGLRIYVVKFHNSDIQGRLIMRQKIQTCARTCAETYTYQGYITITESLVPTMGHAITKDQKHVSD
jgi:hypothetical protein